MSIHGQHTSCTCSPLLLKHGASRPVPGKGAPDSRTARDEDSGRHVICRACGQRLCRESDRTVMNGSHVHVFCNPAGSIFEVACFNQAGGCLPEGPFVSEYSWFPGFSWQIALCAGCFGHLGWRFRGLTGQFHGLITSNITTSEDG